MADLHMETHMLTPETVAMLSDKTMVVEESLLDFYFDALYEDRVVVIMFVEDTNAWIMSDGVRVTSSAIIHAKQAGTKEISDQASLIGAYLADHPNSTVLPSDLRPDALVIGWVPKINKFFKAETDGKVTFSGS